MTLGFVGALALFAAGCGSRSGVDLFSLSGSVTFDGKPVPAGTVTFEPDSAKGNRGPGAVAQIKDGRYSTARGTGHTGGQYLVRILGYDGVPTTIDGKPGGMTLPDGKLLFPPYQTTANLPKASAEQNFEVPASAAAGAKPKG